MFKKLAVLVCLFLCTIGTKGVRAQSLFYNNSIKQQILTPPVDVLKPETYPLFAGLYVATNGLAFRRRRH